MKVAWDYVPGNFIFNIFLGLFSLDASGIIAYCPVIHFYIFVRDHK